MSVDKKSEGAQEASRFLGGASQYDLIWFGGEKNLQLVDVSLEEMNKGSPPRRLEAVDKRLSATMREWTDWDVAGFYLGVSLGIWSASSQVWFREAKGIMWTSGPLGELLSNTLIGLAEAGVLEKRDEPDDQFRWIGVTQ